MTDKRAFVYMIRCANNSLYTGWTDNPFARLHKHKTGTGSKFTRGFNAQRFEYLEELATKSEALKREATIKKLTKKAKEALCEQWAQKTLPHICIGTLAATAEMLEIYTWYVLNHTCTFQITPYTLPEFKEWVEDTLKQSHILLARNSEGKLLGYACAHKYHHREAFEWDVETTIYCAPDARGLGVADLLYPPLLELLRKQGYYNAYGLLADPNPASEAFHKRHGFICEGRSVRIGYKFGKWQGTSVWALQLIKGNSKPKPIKALLTNAELEEFLLKWKNKNPHIR